MLNYFDNLKENARLKVNELSGQTLKLIRLNFPTELEFEPIQLCNAKCFTCPYTKLSGLPDYTKQRMTRNQIEKLLTDFHNNLIKHNYTGPTTINPFRYSDPLVCPDLDFILDFASYNKLQVQITTNAKGLNPRTIPILERNLSAIKDHIFISILGSTEEEVRQNMQIGLEYTKKRLQELANDKSPLIPRITVSLRVISGTPEERQRLENLATEFKNIGVSYHIRSNWIHNRIEGNSSLQNNDHFVVGCKLYRNKLLRRLEVMVNGNVVLCDDDAEGRRVFGNVFEQTIDEIWNGPLKEEHFNIFNDKFSEKKSNLICVNCSRALYEKKSSSVLDTVKEIGVQNLWSQIKLKNYTTIR